MGRGIMYHITLDSENVNTMCEEDFYEELRSLCIDSVKDRPQEDAQNDVRGLAERFKSAGFSIEEYTPLDENESPMWSCPVIKTGDEATLETCKMKYFASAFGKLQKRVQEMSLQTFVSDTSTASSLRTLIANTYADAVYYGEPYEGIYSLDGFVRRMKPNTTYYIAPETVLMH